MPDWWHTFFQGDRRFDSVVLCDAPFLVQKFFDMLDEKVM